MRTLILLSALFLAASASHATPAPTAKEILAKHVQAMGPVDSVKSRRLKMRIVGMAPFELPVMIEAKRPNMIRKEVSIQGSVQVTAFDGKQSWKTDPFVAGGAQPSALPAAEAKALLEEAEFDGILVNPAARGAKVSYVGTAAINGRDAHTLTVTMADGATITIWIDAGSFLEVKRTQMGPAMGTIKPLDIFSSDYRVVGGLRVPHKMEIGLANAKEKIAILVDAVEVNPSIDASRFSKP